LFRAFIFSSAEAAFTSIKTAFCMLEQGSPNFFVQGPHKLHYTTVWGPDILRYVIVSGYVTSIKSTNVAYIYNFFIIDKMSLPAGFGPRAVVVWRTLC